MSTRAPGGAAVNVDGVPSLDEARAFAARLFHDAAFTISDLRAVGQPIVHASPAFEGLTGYAPPDVEGRHLGFLQGSDGDQEGDRTVRDAVRDARACTVVLRNYRADGSLFWNEQRHYPLTDADGRAHLLVSVQTDVTESMQLRGLARASEAMSRHRDGAAQFAYTVLLRPARPPELVWVDDACTHLVGTDAEAVRAEGAGSWVHADDRARFDAAAVARRGEASHAVTYRLVGADGRVRWVEDHARRSWSNPEGRVVAVDAIVRDVTADHRRRGELRNLDGVDALTGLPGAAQFQDRLDTAIAHARRTGGSAGLILLDLDSFAFVNDTIGRRQGDRVIQEVAARLRRTLRGSDGLARTGGDRFALLLRDAGTPERIVAVLHKLQGVLAEPCRWHGGEMHLSATFGVVLLDGSDRDPGEVASAAETALEAAKTAGRGGFRVADDDVHARAVACERDARALRRALQEDELRLHYQPRIDLHSGAVTGVEALVRWLHPDRGLLKPAEFLPLIEASGLEVTLFRWVLERALDQASGWRSAGEPYRVAVNVGAGALLHPEFEGTVRQALADRDLNPALLELELTEDTPFEVFERRIDALQSLRDSGVRVSLDDFGVATASLSQLQRLPLDGLKIDRHFIERLEAGNRADHEMVRAIVAIGRSLELTVVAEGIETEAQRRLLEDLRCDEGQGYLYGRAVPGDYRPVAQAAAEVGPS